MNYIPFWKGEYSFPGNLINWLIKKLNEVFSDVYEKIEGGGGGGGGSYGEDITDTLTFTKIAGMDIFAKRALDMGSFIYLWIQYNGNMPTATSSIRSNYTIAGLPKNWLSGVAGYKYSDRLKVGSTSDARVVLQIQNSIDGANLTLTCPSAEHGTIKFNGWLIIPKQE